MRTFLQTATVAIILFVLAGADFAYAGFGVTPPFVRNTSLTRNSTYEQEILLVRGDPRVPLKATVTVDAPEVVDWIEIVQGNEFLLPRGEQKVPMTVRVVVPDNAEFKNYKGAIRIKTGTPDDEVGAGAVNISLGAQIDLELDVIDKIIKEFRVRRVGVSDLNEGNKLGWLYFPGKINLKMLLENTGNVDVAPSSVRVKIFDATGTVFLEETKSKGRIQKIIPYATEEVIASIPTRLPAGPYRARYEIMNDDQTVYAGELNLNILPYGTLQAAGFGFIGLSAAHKVSIILPFLALILLVLLVIYTRRERRMHNT
tara:strand:+ start:907 stop:1848 length:942 start_codon:yes stop_codon:yes gene_type:complete